MDQQKALAVFEDFKIRRIYDEKAEMWYFSVVDIVAALIQQKDYQAARNYWKVLKNRLKKEGSQTVTNCNRLKMVAEDGKMRLTDVADPETLLRIIQSVPSPKAEPIKLWLAKVGYERIQDMSDPARSLDRAREYWKRHGRSEKWIQQRMMGQETRNKLTDYWKRRPGARWSPAKTSCRRGKGIRRLRRGTQMGRRAMRRPGCKGPATKPDPLFDRVVSILEQASGNVVRAVNTNMVLAHWLIGREIVE